MYVAALPSIQRNPHFSQSGLQWVLSPCALTFGGFLLLGRRAADLFGRRRVWSEYGDSRLRSNLSLAEYGLAGELCVAP